MRAQKQDRQDFDEDVKRKPIFEAKDLIYMDKPTSLQNTIMETVRLENYIQRRPDRTVVNKLYLLSWTYKFITLRKLCRQTVYQFSLKRRETWQTQDRLLILYQQQAVHRHPAALDSKYDEDRHAVAEI